MNMIKEKIGVVAGSVPVIAALALILLPFISYLAWALGQFMLDPAIPRLPAGPSTVLDFIGINAGYMVLGIVLSFMAFPFFVECLKNLKREAQDHSMLLEELHSSDATRGTQNYDDERASNRQLAFYINMIHARQHGVITSGKILCFKCNASISARQNMQFHASCANCHYMWKGMVAYVKGIGFILLALLLAIFSILNVITWAWWVVLGLGLVGLATIVWGHYLREGKARI